MKSTKVQTLATGYTYMQIAYTKHFVGSEDTRHYVIKKSLIIYHLQFV